MIRPHHQQGGKQVKQDASITATSDDTSAVEVTDGGSLTVTDSTVVSTGKSSKVKKSHEEGQNAGVLAKSASSVTLTGHHCHHQVLVPMPCLPMAARARSP